MSISNIVNYHESTFSFQRKYYNQLLKEHTPTDRALIAKYREWLLSNTNRDNAWISAIEMFHTLGSHSRGQNEIIVDLFTDGERYTFMRNYLCSQIHLPEEKCWTFYDIEQYIDPQVALDSETMFGFDERNYNDRDIPLFGNALAYIQSYKAHFFKKMRTIKNLIDRKITSQYGLYISPKILKSKAMERFATDAESLFKETKMFIPLEGINERCGFADHILCPNRETIMRATDFLIGHERRHVWQDTHPEEAKALYARMRKQLWVKRQEAQLIKKGKNRKLSMEEMDADRHGLIHMVKQIHKRAKRSVFVEKREYILRA